MNFLTHIYLSGNNHQVRIGNFMGDSVKGKQYLDFPPAIQKGILLHRKIDSFSDMHPIFQQTRKQLSGLYKHYSGVIVDMYYGYFLAKHWEDFHPQPLAEFVGDFYRLLIENMGVLNEKTKAIVPYMFRENWLMAYATHDGLQKMMYQMDKRTQFRSKMRNSVETLKKNEAIFETDFFRFFPELQLMVEKELKIN